MTEQKHTPGAVEISVWRLGRDQYPPADGMQIALDDSNIGDVIADYGPLPTCCSLPKNA